MRSVAHHQHCCQHSRPHSLSNVSSAGRARSRLRAVQAEQTRTNADLMSLVPWAIKAGIQFAKIKPAVQPDSGRGLLATADIQPGECIINVPIAAAIRVYPGCPTVFQIPLDTWEALPWYGQLALTLLHEAHLGPASKWADYIKQLPTAVDVPVLWSQQEVQQLACNYFISQVQQQQQDWAEIQQQVAPYLSQAGLGVEQLQWALSVTRSRTFAAPYASNPFGAQLGWLSRQAGQQQQQQQQHVLCPLLDLFNHSGEVQSECEYYSDFRSSAFRVVASQAWRRGQQVFINYGSGSNDALLQLYGFVDQGNRDDRYIVECLPDVLQEQGHVISTGAIANLAEVVFTRQGCDMSAAVQLSQLLSEQAPSPSAAQDSTVPFDALVSRVKSICSAALRQELDKLRVDAAADEQVMQAFAELPSKESELAGKQADLEKVQGRLQMLQQMLPDAQHSSTQAPNVEAQPQEQQESQAHSENAADPSQSAQAELESTIGLCLQLSEQLDSQISDLQALLAHWHELVQQNKQLAVSYRLQKHALLLQVMQQLSKSV